MGAGIGRVTKDLLVPYFAAVDVVVRWSLLIVIVIVCWQEQDAKYVAAAKLNVADKRCERQRHCC